MSQHDFNIANQGFPATRADINNAFQAIASNSSGATAPSTTYANMWWYDTTNNKMYLRNEADSAWIEVATIDQTNNEWQITTGVVQAKDGDGLALKTDDGTTRLFINDSDGNVGIGTSSPSARLDVVSTGTTSETIAEFGNGNITDGLSIETNGNLDWGFNTKNSRNMTFSTNQTERMRIDSSGNVGIGTTSPDMGIHLSSGGTNYLRVTNTSSGVGSDFGTSSTGTEIINRQSAPIRFQTNSTERMRISGGGDVGINCIPTYKFEVDSGGSTAAARLRRSTDGTLRTILLFLSSSNSNTVGSISINNTSTSYNTSSDYRLKENVTDVTDGITRVKQLSPKRFNFIADPDTTVDGFIAHEAAVAVPEAVTGTKDAMRDEEYEVTAALGEVYTPAADATYDDDGNELTAATDEVIHSTDVAEPETLADGQLWRETTPAVMGTRSVPDYQGIDQSKLVPLLTAALQEAIAKIEDLEARVAALESA